MVNMSYDYLCQIKIKLIIIIIIIINIDFQSTENFLNNIKQDQKKFLTKNILRNSR